MPVTVCKGSSILGCMALHDTMNISAYAEFASSVPLRVFLFDGGEHLSEYKALYRTWRPKTFDDVCGQDGITDILKYQVLNNKLSHAYLFCGSRGTGKTSCAKILAKAVNCLQPQNGNPCNCCEACKSIDSGIATDVIEMDAASNNGIGDVRDMQDEIAFTPALFKYRVYIIDEVHMMSTQAFNALLKTLEEPPKYVIFILATTEYNKLPNTIVSRCQRYDFKRIPTDVIMSRLMKMSESEKIDITEDAARIIARIARGGMRDAISLLELCAGAHVKIDEELVFATVGSGNRESAYKIIEAVSKADYSTVYAIMDEIVMKSGDVSVFWQELIDTYRDLMIVKNSDKAKTYLDLTDVEYSYLSVIASQFTMARLSYHVSILESAIADMQRAFNSKRSVAEIALTRMCDPKHQFSMESLILRIEELEKEVTMIKLGVVPIMGSQSAEPISGTPESDTKPVEDKKEADTNEAQETEQIYAGWGDVIERIGEFKRSLSAGISGASVYRRGHTTFIIKLNDFFAKKLSSSETDMTIVRSVIAERERKSPFEIKIKIVSATANYDSPFSEIENAIK